MLTKMRTRSHISMIAMVGQAVVIAFAAMILHVATAAAERFFSVHLYY